MGNQFSDIQNKFQELMKMIKQKEENFEKNLETSENAAVEI